MKQHIFSAIANSVKSLAMDAVQKANSGHPGMPLGMAEFGAYLYGELLQHNPKNSHWPNRDRFILSAGHGSVWLYALLHLSGYDLSLNDIKAFRQLGSKTPGHPEYGHSDGVETTTGPLGQGVANAVGFAIAESMLAARYNTATHSIVDHYTYVLAGDGCLMEGVSAEASSLAGHLGLGKLILFYDSNHISIDGATDITFSEDVKARYASYGWQVLEADPYTLTSLQQAVREAKQQSSQPTLIVLPSVIAKGSPGKAGSAAAHGAPLGVEEVIATKKVLGLDPAQQFYVDETARAFFRAREEYCAGAEQEWQEKFTQWADENPGLLEEWKECHTTSIEQTLQQLGVPSFQRGEQISTRKASAAMLQALARLLPNLVGGSADLAASNLTDVNEWTDFSVQNRRGNTLRFGVREHGMASIVNGIVLHGGLKAFCATFLVFSDYMRASMRLSALMQIPTIFVFTHDSVHLGEDGPTHQPVEHLAALRAIPGMRVLRPGDAEELTEAWLIALKSKGPTCIVCTRQNLPVYEKWDAEWRRGMAEGAYIVHEPSQEPDIVVLATGSEVALALEASRHSKRAVRLISVADFVTFRDSPQRQRLIPPKAKVVVVEAGIAQGWECVADRSNIISIERFGISGSGAEVAAALGITLKALGDKLA